MIGWEREDFGGLESYSSKDGRWKITRLNAYIVYERTAPGRYDHADGTEAGGPSFWELDDAKTYCEQREGLTP